jgi:hypothetical protein
MTAAVPIAAQSPKLTYSTGLYDAPAGFSFDGPVAGAVPPPEPVAVEERETLELVRAFRRIRDPQVRRRLYELAKALGGMRHPG